VGQVAADPNCQIGLAIGVRAHPFFELDPSRFQGFHFPDPSKKPNDVNSHNDI
jgi:hypothetical protein